MTSLDALLVRVSDVYGLKPREDWRAIAEGAIVGIAERRGVSVQELLTSDDHRRDAMAHVVESLTIGETYFLRHPTHFLALNRSIARALREPDRTVAVWCAGCATGEEPYSVAISVAELCGVGALDRLKIVATDVNPASIARARAGVYGPWSLRDAPPWLPARYFKQTGEKEWRLTCEPVLAAVTFEIAGITARAEALLDASLDAMLFRNVGIYMTPAAVALVHEHALRIIRPGGLFFVAPSDPRPTNRLFKACDDPSTSVYERAPPTRASEAPPPARRSPPRAHRRGLTPTPSRAPAYHPAANTTTAASALRASAVTTKPTQEAPSGSSIAAARELANNGDLDAALEALAASRALYSGEAALLQAQILMEKGQHDDAVSELRRLTFHEPGHRIARYWYAIALESAGRRAQALTQARALRGSLVGPPAQVLEDGSTTSGELQAAARALEERLG